MDARPNMSTDNKSPNIGRRQNEKKKKLKTTLKTMNFASAKNLETLLDDKQQEKSSDSGNEHLNFLITRRKELNETRKNQYRDREKKEINLTRFQQNDFVPIQIKKEQTELKPKEIRKQGNICKIDGINEKNVRSKKKQEEQSEDRSNIKQLYFFHQTMVRSDRQKRITRWKLIYYQRKENLTVVENF